MGAEAFTDHCMGPDAKTAFRTAKDEAAWQSGHGGYTGTIAEKHDFVTISAEPVSLRRALEIADELIEDDDSRIADKWGPAGCIPVDDGTFVFFGWASS